MTLGVDLAAMPASQNQRTYRGQVVEPTSESAVESASNETGAGEPVKKKKIIYR